MADITIREGLREDLPAVLSMIKGLALFERAPDAVIVTLEELERDGFGDEPIFHFKIAEKEGEVIGMALFYIGYSTWKGKLLYLDDLFVPEEHRGLGAGKMLLDAVIAFGQQVGAKCIKWQVLDWNEPAIEFYKKYGVEFDGEWIDCKLQWEQIKAFKA